jgi:hypothetical protein
MAFSFQMMGEEHKSSLDVHYERQSIVVKVLIDTFASSSSSLESMVQALIS